MPNSPTATSATPDLIASLQALQSQLESARTNEPSALPSLLSSALSETRGLLTQLPPSESEEWLTHLSKLSSSCEHAKVNAVQCIHHCGETFCTASCRRRLAGEHAKRCRALREKQVLRKIGLADREMF